MRAPSLFPRKRARLYQWTSVLPSPSCSWIDVRESRIVLPLLVDLVLPHHPPHTVHTVRTPAYAQPFAPRPVLPSCHPCIPSSLSPLPPTSLTTCPLHPSSPHIQAIHLAHPEQKVNPIECRYSAVSVASSPSYPSNDTRSYYCHPGLPSPPTSAVIALNKRQGG